MAYRIRFGQMWSPSSTHRRFLVIWVLVENGNIWNKPAIEQIQSLSEHPIWGSWDEHPGFQHVSPELRWRRYGTPIGEAALLWRNLDMFMPHICNQISVNLQSCRFLFTRLSLCKYLRKQNLRYLDQISFEFVMQLCTNLSYSHFFLGNHQSVLGEFQLPIRRLSYRPKEPRARICIMLCTKYGCCSCQRSERWAQWNGENICMQLDSNPWRYPSPTLKGFWIVTKNYPSQVWWLVTASLGGHMVRNPSSGPWIQAPAYPKILKETWQQTPSDQCNGLIYTLEDRQSEDSNIPHFLK